MAELTVLYDGGCGLCRASVERVRPYDSSGKIEFVDVNDVSVGARFPQVDRREALRWMQAVDSRGRVSAGVDAWARIGRLLPGWRYAAWLLVVPGIHFLAQRTYAFIARNRYRWNRELCADGSCTLHASEPAATHPASPPSEQGGYKAS